MTLDLLDDSDNEFFMDIPSTANPQTGGYTPNNNPNNGSRSDIKVIEINSKPSGYYRPPSIKEDYGGDYDDKSGNDSAE
jgi:hypothetical protein